MKFCTNCGGSVEETAKFCPSCGASLTQENEQAIFNDRDKSYRSLDKGQYETATLILGIVGVSLAFMNYIGIPFVHLIAIVLGIIGITLVKKDKDEQRSYSKPGYVLSIVALVLGVLSIVLGIILVSTL